MKHCESIEMEIAPHGAIFRGKRWPEEIKVERNLLDYLPGPHVSFGRAGVLRFNAINGNAAYRRIEDIPGGWNYRLVESNLRATPQPATAAAKLQDASKRYAQVDGPGKGTSAEAFQWLPNAVPPAMLPDWFVRSDFQHIAAEGKLIIRIPGLQSYHALDGDFVVRQHGKIFPMKPEKFTQQYSEMK